ncbi:hypothetical protein HanRHA438_Chr11g0484401 [Helianthus annuus]|nr:hypothetical protein HanRHA438_Chr11g0484401 [Helianthus annuus]
MILKVNQINRGVIITSSHQIKSDRKSPDTRVPSISQSPEENYRSEMFLARSTPNNPV